jgi:hypothetical protein
MLTKILRTFGRRKVADFDPITVGLSGDFVLTNYTKMKG